MINGSSSFGSEFRYWGSFGGGLGNRDFYEYIYSPLDISANVSHNNFLLNIGIDLVHRTERICALRCYESPNKFIVNSLIGYLKTWNKFGFSAKTGLSFSNPYGGNIDQKDTWEFGLPIKTMFMIRLHQYIGLESGISTWARNGDFTKTDYYTIARIGLIFGAIPFN